MLTGHQRIAVLRAFPHAKVDDREIRIGRRTFAIRNGRPGIPEAEGPLGRRYFDGRDEGDGALVAGLRGTRMRLTAHQIIAIRRRAPDFAIEEVGPGACRVTLDRAWAVVLLTRAGWESSGPWQLVRDQETLRDRNHLRENLRELGGINL